jgi:hypothetical protein
MNEKKILESAVKAAGEHAYAKVLWVMHPLLETMALRFAAYVGPHAITDSGKLLLPSALKQALRSFSAWEDNEQKARAAFVRSLLDCSDDVFAQRLVIATPRGDICWNPFSCGAMEFVETYGNAEPKASRQACKIGAAITRTFMMMQIIPAALLDNDSLSELLDMPEVA